jgi:hypothetical protein
MIPHAWAAAFLLGASWFIPGYPIIGILSFFAVLAYFFVRSVRAGTSDRAKGIHEALVVAGVRPVDYFWGRALPVLKEWAVYVFCGLVISFMLWMSEPTGEVSFLAYWPRFLLGGMALSGLFMMWVAIGLHAPAPAIAWTYAAVAGVAWFAFGLGLFLLIEWLYYLGLTTPGLDLAMMLMGPIMRCFFYWIVLNMLLLPGPWYAYGANERYRLGDRTSIAEVHFMNFIEVSIKGFGILVLLLIMGMFV